MDFHPPKEWMDNWVYTRREMLRTVGFFVEYIKFFKTKRGWHAYIKLDRDIFDETANMLQFLLGDDHTRVKINQWRIKRGIKRWNKLFHKVLYRRKAKVLTCYYCGNKIPVPDKWFKNEAEQN